MQDIRTKLHVEARSARLRELYLKANTTWSSLYHAVKAMGEPWEQFDQAYHAGLVKSEQLAYQLLEHLINMRSEENGPSPETEQMFNFTHGGARDA